MTISEIMKKMILYSNGNTHDINHFMKVYGYAKMIGECEHLAAKEQKILEIAAILHDIACPLCREKYGNSPYTSSGAAKSGQWFPAVTARLRVRSHDSCLLCAGFVVPGPRRPEG